MNFLNQTVCIDQLILKTHKCVGKHIYTVSTLFINNINMKCTSEKLFAFC